jgi:glutaredoxin
MEEGIGKRMMESNGGHKIIPTIFIDDQVVLGFDRNRLKQLLGIK